jgi:excinuclease ABC subunit C
VRETLDVLTRVFQSRPCEGPKPGRHSGIPCLDYHIDRCKAPCVGYVAKDEYREIIDRVIEFLSGETRPVLRDLERRMQEAAAQERFEDAARYRNRLFAIRHLAERQAADKRAVGTVDVIGIAIDGDRAAVQIFPLRDGKLVDRYGFHLENVAGRDTAAVLEAFALEYYGSSPSVPPQLVVPPDSGDTAALEEFLSDRRGSRVEVRSPARGEKRRLQQLADHNARLAVQSERIQSEQRRLRRVEALEELREVLNLESLPIRIECFDISNIQSESPVGSMVVFRDAVPHRAHYRKFGVRRLDGPDDFAAIAEVVSRRFARLGEVTAEEYDESFAAAPNLVVIDGGKGQLSAALAAMQAFDLPRVAVISLAKRAEEVFVPGRPDSIVLPRDSAGLQLLQRIRDEAHRFALGFHRQRRDAKARDSLFDELQGVGPARRRALLRHFGSTERLLEATQEELEGVPGVPPKTARAIYAQLHKAGRA